MIYDTGSKKESQFRSVNELIDPKKYGNYNSPYLVDTLRQNDISVSTPTSVIQLETNTPSPAPEEAIDQVRPSIAWNNTQGGINLSYRIINGKLKQNTAINVYWANGSTHENRMGDPVFCYNVPADTPEGECEPIHINGTDLANDPPGVTHLIATNSESSVGALADVQVNYGANASAATVWNTTIDIIKDGLRASGQSTATITSTSRTPADQARAMFQNLVNANNTVNANVANQLALYGAPGDAVINVFVQQTNGMSYPQIIQNGTTIRAAMEQEINNQGPGNVSRHCADPTQRNVVDVGSGVFNANNSGLFITAVQNRARLIDERNSNGCFHIEVQN
jgi:hypothetical protein